MAQMAMACCRPSVSVIKHATRKLGMKETMRCIREAVIQPRGQMLIFCFDKMRGHIRTYNLAEISLTKWKLGSTEPGQQRRFIADLDNGYELKCTARRVAGIVTVRRSLCLLIFNTKCLIDRVELPLQMVAVSTVVLELECSSKQWWRCVFFPHLRPAGEDVATMSSPPALSRSPGKYVQNMRGG